MVRNFGHDLDGLVTRQPRQGVAVPHAVNVLDRPGSRGDRADRPPRDSCCRCCTRRWLQLASAQRAAGKQPERQRPAVDRPARRREWPLTAWSETTMSADLIELVQRLGQPRVLVVGDVMLDRYVWGDAERISQEAPVILLRADTREERLGGASSVATMLRALGARRQRWPASSAPTPTAAAFGRSSPTSASTTRRVVTDADRPTHGQGALHRPGPAPPSAADDPRRLRGPRAGRRRRSSGSSCRLVAQQLAQGRRRADQRLRQGRLHAGPAGRGHRRGAGAGASACIADPIRGSDYRKYHGCSAITPNRLEAGLATGRTLDDDRTRRWRPPRQLREQLDLEAGIVTLDKDGMALAHRDGRRQHLPDPAAAGVRHHRRRRHGHERARHGPGRRGRLRRRPSAWPTSPAGWRSRRSASPR